MAGLWLTAGLLARHSLWRELSDHPLFWPVAAVMAVQTLATICATDPRLSFWGSYERAQGWLTLVSYSLLFILTAARLRSLEQAHRLALALALVAIPLTALGLAQALGWTPLPLVTDARSPVYATLGRANFLGATLAMLLPLTLAMGLSGEGEDRSGPGCPRFLSRRLLSRRLGYAALVLAELAVIGLTRARGAWVAAGAALALFALILSWRWLGEKGRWTRVLAVGGLALAAAAAGGAALVVGRGAGSTAARLTIWRAVLPLIAERPLLGHGPDALGLVFPRVYPPELVYTQGRGVLVDRAHNLLLDWAVTTGSAGVLAQGALLALFFVLGWRAAVRAVDPGRRVLLAACLAAVGGNVAGTLVSFDVTATATMTALTMALGVALARQEGPSVAWGPVDVTRARPRGAAAILIALIFSGLGAAVWQANLRPSLADAAALMADRRAAAGDWDGAVSAAERAVALWPREPTYHRAVSWAWLQWVLRGGGDAEHGLARAEAALLEARDLRPGDGPTWAALGELYGVWGNRYDPSRLPMAHAAYAQAVALAPTTAVLYTAWGMVDLEGEHFAQAAARFRRAVDLDATDGYAFAHLGDAETAQGHTGAAREAFEKAVHWEPELVAAHVGLARCLRLQGRQAEASAALRRALALDPGNPAGLALQSEMGVSP
jgi:tetratricopeptide (TPR) repeat protein/O-antigen ligase